MPRSSAFLHLLLLLFTSSPSQLDPYTTTTYPATAMTSRIRKALTPQPSSGRDTSYLAFRYVVPANKASDFCYGTDHDGVKSVGLTTARAPSEFPTIRQPLSQIAGLSDTFRTADAQRQTQFGAEDEATRFRAVFRSFGNDYRCLRTSIVPWTMQNGQKRYGSTITTWEHLHRATADQRTASR